MKLATFDRLDYRFFCCPDAQPKRLRLLSIANPPNANNAIVAGSGTSETRNPIWMLSSDG